jgi:hypothetical protein
MKITDYLLLRSDNLSDLQSLVQHAISEGWQPLGGVAAVAEYSFKDADGDTQHTYDYAQALVRYQALPSVLP